MVREDDALTIPNFATSTRCEFIAFAPIIPAQMVELISLRRVKK